MNKGQEDNDNIYGDSDFLAYRDIASDDFRKSEKDSKIQIMKKMVELHHNMKYNKHLLSVYLKAKSLFDNMVDEHRTQISYLDEIYTHINNMIRENHSNRKNTMTTELLKDKKRIGLLLKKMRNSYEKLTNVYTVLDVTVQKMNEMAVSMEEAEAGMDDDSQYDMEDDDDVEDKTDNEDMDDEDEDMDDEDEDMDDEDGEDEDMDDEDEDEDMDDEDEDEDMDDEDEDMENADESDENMDGEKEDMDDEDEDMDEDDEDAEDDDDVENADESDENMDGENDVKADEADEADEADDTEEPFIMVF